MRPTYAHELASADVACSLAIRILPLHSIIVLSILFNVVSPERFFLGLTKNNILHSELMQLFKVYFLNVNCERRCSPRWRRPQCLHFLGRHDFLARNQIPTRSALFIVQVMSFGLRAISRTLTGCRLPACYERQDGGGNCAIFLL